MDAATAPTEKHVFFVRHGHGEHSDGSWGIRDPQLTPKGMWQARRCQGLEALTNESYLLVVSPLRRCIETAFGLPLSVGAQPRVVVTAKHRERWSDSCDEGTSREDLQKLYPWLEGWAEWDSDTDSRVWWDTDWTDWKKERVPVFLAWLRRQPESRILVVGHGSFTQGMGLPLAEHCECQMATLSHDTLTFVKSWKPIIQPLLCWLDYDAAADRMRTEEREILAALSQCGWKTCVVAAWRDVPPEADLIVSRWSSQDDPHAGGSYAQQLSQIAPTCFWSTTLQTADHKLRASAYRHWCAVMDSYRELSSLVEPHKLVIIGITGASHSGKSTLARSLAQHFESSVVIKQDSFGHRSLQVSHWDWPDASLHLEFKRHVFAALAGKRPSVLIFEGFMAFFDPLLAAICSHRFMINVTRATARQRRFETQGMPFEVYDAEVT